MQELWKATLQFFLNNFDLVLLGSITLIQIAPIKINPWTKVSKCIEEKINGDIKKDVAELKRDFEETKANDMRWYILNFANSCRNNVRHSKEEWEHLLSQLKEYETYTKAKEINNGVIEEDAKYLRNLYQERCIKNDFLI